MMCFSLLFIVACDACACVVFGLLLIFLSFSFSILRIIFLYFGSTSLSITTASSAVLSSLSTFLLGSPLFFPYSMHAEFSRRSYECNATETMTIQRVFRRCVLVYAWARVHEHEHMKWRRYSYSYLPQTLRRAIHIFCSLFCLQSTLHSHTHHTQCGRSCVFQSHFFLSYFLLFFSLSART